jgi:hypothetical protein
MNKLKPLALAALCALAFAAVAFAAAKTMSVQIRDAQLREGPSFLSKIVGPVPYAQQVEVVEEKGDWSKVAPAAGPPGWLHASALSDKKLALAAGSGDAAQGVSGKEMALAGKGFNSQVEGEYRRSHGAGYDWIDKMGKVAYQPEAMMAFLAQGEIYPRDGGAK